MSQKVEELLRTQNPLSIGRFLQIPSGPRICVCTIYYCYSLPHSCFSGDRIPCCSLSIKPFCHFCLLSCLSGWTILELGGGDLENQPAIRDCSSVQGHAPWDSSKQVFEQDKICSEVQNCDTDLGTSPTSQDLEFHSSWSLEPSLPTTFMFVSDLSECLPLLALLPSTSGNPHPCAPETSQITCVLLCCVQQVSGWMESPMRTRACKHEISSGCLQKGPSVPPSQAGSSSKAPTLLLPLILTCKF